jgi:hypothetical protein
MARWPGIPVLLLRRDLKDLKATTEREWQRVCERELYSPPYGQYHRTERWYRWPNGSTLYLGDLKDWESYKSMTLGLIAIDELNEVDEEAFINLDPTLRWSTGKGRCDRAECAGFEPHPEHPFYQIVAATNPSPGWVKTRFYDPWREGNELPNHRFVPATAFDNPSLPPDYIPSLLNNNNERWVENYVLGDWQAFENQVWPSIQRHAHMFREPPPLSRARRIVGGIDYGGTSSTSHNTVAILVAELQNGQILTFWEHVQQGGPTDQFYHTLRSAQERYRVSAWYADASQERANGLLQMLGLPVYNAPRYPGSVRDGVNLIHQLSLRSLPSGEPVLLIHESCHRLWAGIETYALDPERGEPAKNQQDDEVDAWRYAIYGLTGGHVPGNSIEVRPIAPQPSRATSKPSQFLEAIRQARRARIRAIVSQAESQNVMYPQPVPRKAKRLNLIDE